MYGKTWCLVKMIGCLFWMTGRYIYTKAYCLIWMLIPVIGILNTVQTCHWLGSNRNILSGNGEIRCGFSVFVS